jgi:lipid A 3-O-deacylase
MKTTTMLQLAAAAALLAPSAPALAVDFAPVGASIEAGIGRQGTRMAGVGLVWDWDFERLRRKAELTAHTELMVNRWRADAVGGGNFELTQLVVLPSLRMRLDRGASPWFVEVGIGASWMDRDFETPRKRFSTRWNFYDMLGVGHTYGGVDGHHEVGVRWSHVSNAGIRKPNPGQDFLQLRYVYRF